MKCIINADDFGLNERCTLAIVKAFALGLVTDTTMVANGAAFDLAVSIADGTRRYPGYPHAKENLANRIGIHLNLTEGEPLTEAIKDIPDFVSGGRFHKQYDGRPLTEHEAEAVYLELNAQVQRIKKTGIAITHADSHHYIHNFAALAPIAARICQENGIKKIRLYRTFGSEKDGFDPKILPNEQWRAWGFVTTDHFGRMSDAASTIPDNTEIMVHPDFDRDGVLIDRRGMKDGYPVGEPLTDLSGRADLVSYYNY